MTKPTQNILSKEPTHNHIQANDRFYVNDSFMSKHYRVKLQSHREKLPSTFESKEIQDTLQNDRHRRIDAAIVRSMKIHKTMTHAELITEVSISNRYYG